MGIKIGMTEEEFRIKTVQLARTQVGYVEGTGFGGRSNYTKFWLDLYPAFQGQPWCGGFNSWVFWKLTGIKLAWDFFNSYYTPAIVTYGKRHGAWKTSHPQPGDWCLMNFPGGNSVDHTGIVASGRTNIEGNTSPGNAGSQRNGGGVYVRTRPSSIIAGWVDLIKLAKLAGVEFDAPRPVDRRIDTDGEIGPQTTKTVQRWLNILRTAKLKRGASVRNWPALKVDGEWGPQTYKALQAATGSPVDGEDGPKTAAKVADYIKVKTSRKLPLKDNSGLVKALQEYLNVLIVAGKL